MANSIRAVSIFIMIHTGIIIIIKEVTISSAAEAEEFHLREYTMRNIQLRISTYKVSAHRKAGIKAFNCINNTDPTASRIRIKESWRILLWSKYCIVMMG